MNALEEYWSLWLQLDALPDAQLEGAEGDALRDRMDSPYWQMTEVERSEFGQGWRIKGGAEGKS